MVMTMLPGHASGSMQNSRATPRSQNRRTGAMPTLFRRPRFPVLMAISRAEVHVPEPGIYNATAGVHHAVRWRDGMAACGVGPGKHLAGPVRSRWVATWA